MNSFSDQAQGIWDTNAALWDHIHGENGNRFHRRIVEPSVLRLLQPQAGEQMLDVGCGTGVLARTLAQFGVQVIASDWSAELLKHAQAYQEQEPLDIEYLQLDATNEAALLKLGQARFDAIVSTMALMDMAEIAPLFRAVRVLLKPHGRFVWAVQHPCFNSNGSAKIVELEDRDGAMITRHAIKVWRYRTAWNEHAIGIQGQDQAHPIFHRPIEVLLQTGFKSGLIVDGLEEPTDPDPYNEQKWWAWANYAETPPVLVVRMRAAA